ncbi:hypothetical protein CEXT_473291 [Caerostris extrusa]|uniref:Uncharacterized protein n=1 Tax=Caerostris extrusa TaxID=172846 RepID=A0AAV4S1L8_CAEEX|nr:hypothetical protein CEXT_473291 [Caerostris extrusa]
MISEAMCGRSKYVLYVPSNRNHDAGTPKCLVICAVNGVGRSLVRGCKWSRDSLTLRERGVIRVYANRLINGVIVRGAISRDQSTPAHEGQD